MEDTINMPTDPGPEPDACIHWVCRRLFPEVVTACVFVLRISADVVVVPGATLAERVSTAEHLNARSGRVHVPARGREDVYELAAPCVDCDVSGGSWCEVCGGEGVVPLAVPNSSADFPADMQPRH